MKNIVDNENEKDVMFVPMTGSLVGGIRKDKPDRITAAMAELQIGIYGICNQLEGMNEAAPGTEWLDAFARICSIFLRKTVLGDSGERNSRLLDDNVIETTGLKFDRLRKIPVNVRRTLEIGFGLKGGGIVLERLDENTHEPVETYSFSAAAQEVKISIE